MSWDNWENISINTCINSESHFGSGFIHTLLFGSPGFVLIKYFQETAEVPTAQIHLIKNPYVFHGKTIFFLVRKGLLLTRYHPHNSDTWNAQGPQCSKFYIPFYIGKSEVKRDGSSFQSTGIGGLLSQWRQLHNTEPRHWAGRCLEENIREHYTVLCLYSCSSVEVKYLYPFKTRGQQHFGAECQKPLQPGLQRCWCPGADSRGTTRSPIPVVAA